MHWLQSGFEKFSNVFGYNYSLCAMCRAHQLCMVVSDFGLKQKHKSPWQTRTNCLFAYVLFLCHFQIKWVTLFCFDTIFFSTFNFFFVTTLFVTQFFLCVDHFILWIYFGWTIFRIYFNLYAFLVSLNCHLNEKLSKLLLDCSCVFCLQR